MTNLTNTNLNKNTILAGNNIESSKDKNFFDNSVLNKIQNFNSSNSNEKTNVGKILLNLLKKMILNILYFNLNY